MLCRFFLPIIQLNIRDLNNIEYQLKDYFMVFINDFVKFVFRKYART